MVHASAYYAGCSNPAETIVKWVGTNGRLPVLVRLEKKIIIAAHVIHESHPSVRLLKIGPVVFKFSNNNEIQTVSILFITTYVYICYFLPGGHIRVAKEKEGRGSGEAAQKREEKKARKIW